MTKKFNFSTSQEMSLPDLAEKVWGNLGFTENVADFVVELSDAALDFEFDILMIKHFKQVEINLRESLGEDVGDLSPELIKV